MLNYMPIINDELIGHEALMGYLNIILALFTEIKGKPWAQQQHLTEPCFQ
jgi:hypothetical protein